VKEGLSDIVVLLDRSGSMMKIRDDAIGGFNGFIEDQKAVPGEAVVTLVQFDTQDPHEVVYGRTSLGEVPELTGDTYMPRASTPLYDALAFTIDHIGGILDKLPEEEKPEHVVFAILTDGLENSSREYDKAAVFARVSHQQEKWGWKFIYLGANQDAMVEAAFLGIKYDPQGQNIANFVASAEGTEKAYRSASRSATHYRTTP